MNNPRNCAVGILVLTLSFSLCTMPTKADKAFGEMSIKHTLLLLKSADLSEEDALRLEKKLAEQPTDIESRVKLLGYYFLRQFDTKEARSKRQSHVLWVIEHAPRSSIARLGYARLDPISDGDAYRRGKELWLKATESYATDPTILENAAGFFSIQDTPLALDLLERGRAQQPGNPYWSSQIGHLLSLESMIESSDSRKEATLKAFENMERGVQDSKDPMGRYCRLPELAESAFEAEKYDLAEGYARELLEFKPPYVSFMDGNAVHYGNIVLGRVALAFDDIGKAKEHLIAAGKTKGSPQLDSFGPDTKLARALLERGEKDAVIEYLRLCGTFWSDDIATLESWIKMIKADKISVFNKRLGD